jgi:hypothetical protein
MDSRKYVGAYGIAVAVALLPAAQKMPLAFE